VWNKKTSGFNTQKFSLAWDCPRPKVCSRSYPWFFNTLLCSFFRQSCLPANHKTPQQRYLRVYLQRGGQRKYLVLFSGSLGGNGAYQHISIPESAARPAPRFQGLWIKGPVKKTDKRIFDITLSGNKLLLLREEALCGIDLDGYLAKESVTVIVPNAQGMEKTATVEDGLCVVCNRNRYAALALPGGTRDESF
jgi:hypothetical protein